MILRTIGILALLMTMLVAASDVQARIYKTVDEDGNVVFTDVPPKDHSKAIEIEAGNTYKPPQPTALTPNRRRSEQTNPDIEEAAEEAAANYSSLRIVTPKNDEAVRENAGNLRVVVSVSPNLKDTHSLQILVDGAVFPTDGGTNLQLSNVDRGTHVLTAQIIDSSGTVLMSSNPTSFHMQRISLNSPSRAPS
jgi:hypothetical protein